MNRIAANILGTLALLATAFCALTCEAQQSPASHPTQARPVCAVSPGCAPGHSLKPSARLFRAIHAVENPHNRPAGHAAQGPYQIQPRFWADGCRWGGYGWSYSPWNVARCQAVMRAYWNHYHAFTDEQRARLFNQGWGGQHNAAAGRYWHLVKKEL